MLIENNYTVLKNGAGPSTGRPPLKPTPARQAPQLPPQEPATPSFLGKVFNRVGDVVRALTPKGKEKRQSQVAEPVSQAFLKIAEKQMARQNEAEQAEEARRANEAVTKVQTMVRGKIARSKLSKLRTEAKAVQAQELVDEAVKDFMKELVPSSKAKYEGKFKSQMDDLEAYEEQGKKVKLKGNETQEELVRKGLQARGIQALKPSDVWIQEAKNIIDYNVQQGHLTKQEAEDLRKRYTTKWNPGIISFVRSVAPNVFDKYEIETLEKGGTTSSL